MFPDVAAKVLAKDQYPANANTTVTPFTLTLIHLPVHPSLILVHHIRLIPYLSTRTRAFALIILYRRLYRGINNGSLFGMHPSVQPDTNMTLTATVLYIAP
jgi:hypothetical protein